MVLGTLRCGSTYPQAWVYCSTVWWSRARGEACIRGQVERAVTVPGPREGCSEHHPGPVRGMHEGEVVWEPYEYYLHPDRDLAPPIIRQDEHLWYARVPMVHFWMVEWHYPDRVMRQFGRWQRIPPLPPAQDWDEHEKLLVQKHSKEDHDRQPDWSQIHARYIEV